MVRVDHDMIRWCGFEDESSASATFVRVFTPMRPMRYDTKIRMNYSAVSSVPNSVIPIEMTLNGI